MATLTLAVDSEALSNPQFPDLSPEIFEAMPSHIRVWRKHSPSLKEQYQKILEREVKV